jgi:hypothetical protein
MEDREGNEAGSDCPDGGHLAVEEPGFGSFPVPGDPVWGGPHGGRASCVVAAISDCDEAVTPGGQAADPKIGIGHVLPGDTVG